MTRLIDADALTATLEEVGQYLKSPAFQLACIAAINEVKNTPTINAVPVRHGKWIYGNDFHWYTASCSTCGYQRRTDIKVTGWNQWKYCPNCGAKMDAERKEE